MGLIFKPTEFANLATTQLSSADVKLYKNASIKISPEAISLLGINKDNRLFLDKHPMAGKFFIAAVSATFDKEGKEVVFGKKLNDNNSFSNKTLHAFLGGELSEWDIDKDNAQEGEDANGEKVTYYALVEKVNGEERRKELAEESENADKAENSENTNDPESGNPENDANFEAEPDSEEKPEDHFNPEV
jgi:hypothetical protein